MLSFFFYSVLFLPLLFILTFLLLFLLLNLLLIFVCILFYFLFWFPIIILFLVTALLLLKLLNFLSMLLSPPVILLINDLPLWSGWLSAESCDATCWDVLAWTEGYKTKPLSKDQNHKIQKGEEDWSIIASLLKARESTPVSSNLVNNHGKDLDVHRPQPQGWPLTLGCWLTHLIFSRGWALIMLSEEQAVDTSHFKNKGCCTKSKTHAFCLCGGYLQPMLQFFTFITDLDWWCKVSPVHHRGWATSHLWTEVKPFPVPQLPDKELPHRQPCVLTQHRKGCNTKQKAEAVF